MIKSINNYILSIFIYIAATPIFMVCFLLFLLLNMLNKRLSYKAIKFISKIMLYSFGIRTKIYGVFPKKTQYIVMMNHSSFLDMFLYPLVVSGRWTGITAKENFKYPLLSTVLKKMNAIPIKRTNKIGAIKTIKVAEEKIKEGYHIGIMPEGARTLDGRLLPFKKGGFHMALNTKTPILPIGVSGAFAAKPRNRWWIRPGNVIIKIGQPVEVEKFNKNNIDLFIQTVKSQIIYLSSDKD